MLKTASILKPTTQKGYLHQCKYHTEEVFFLWQVNGFAVTTAKDQTDIKLIKQIDSHMTVDIKDLCLLTQYN